MKKLLIVLMVLAMSSFLFVGCMPSVTPPVVEEEEEEVVVEVPTTGTPVITSVSDIDIASTSTQYISKTEAADGITVTGNASTFAEVKVYINDVAIAASADVAANGTWSLSVTKAELGTDGEKTLKAVALEIGLADATSTEYAFVLDTVAPGITEVKATAIKAAGGGTATDNVTAPDTAGNAAMTVAADIEDGTWLIEVLGGSGIADNVKVTFPDGSIVIYGNVVNGAIWGAGAPIPGATFTFNGALAAAQQTTVDCVAQTAPIVDRATLKFDEDVTSATAIAGTYTLTAITGGGAFPATLTFKSSNNTVYWDSFTGALAQYDSIRFSAAGVKDLAGNAISAASPVVATCTVGAASKTALKP